MGRISDIIPPLYYDAENDLIRYTDCLDVEIAELESKIKGITDLINVDKCPDDKLPYLAAMTNCPLMGDDAVLWRKQIKNWPYLLKIKGTALSLEVFLNTIDVDEHKISASFAEPYIPRDEYEGKTLYINFREKDGANFNKCVDTLVASKGSSPVFFRFIDKKKQGRFSKCDVQISAPLISALKGILGNDGIEIR